MGVESEDNGYHPRSPISVADAARFQHDWAVQQQQDANLAAICWSVMILVALLAAYWAFRHRRQIARAADTAAVSGLATGVRTVRAARSTKDAFMARVLAKADENTPSPD